MTEDPWLDVKVTLARTDFLLGNRNGKSRELSGGEGGGLSGVFGSSTTVLARTRLDFCYPVLVACQLDFGVASPVSLGSGIKRGGHVTLRVLRTFELT